MDSFIVCQNCLYILSSAKTIFYIKVIKVYSRRWIHLIARNCSKSKILKQDSTNRRFVYKYIYQWAELHKQVWRWILIEAYCKSKNFCWYNITISCLNLLKQKKNNLNSNPCWIHVIAFCIIFFVLGFSIIFLWMYEF